MPISRLNTLSEQIRRQPQCLIIAEALGLAALVGIADFFTRYDISLFVLYALPILFIVWFSKTKNTDILVGIACTIAWVTSEIAVHHPESGMSILLWNTLFQLGFMVFTLICSRALKDRLDRSTAEVEELKSFYLLAEIAPIGIFRTDAKGNILYANQHWLRLSGEQQKRIRHQLWSDALHPDDHERVMREWQRTRKEGEALHFEARIQSENPSWALGHVAAERTPDGSITGFVGAVADVSAHRKLEQEVLSIAEREQQRIGQDLHDDLCQFLAAIQFGASSLRTDLQRRNAAEATEAAELADYLKEAIVRTRHLARRIFPAQLEQSGLISALHELAASTSRLAGIRCTFEHEPPLNVSDATATQLYRITQEALGNAIRHGQAKVVTIHLLAQRDRITLSIEDNGSGLQLPLPRDHDGMGLRIMEYRSHMIGGTLQFEARPGGGTLVKCSFRRPSSHA